jgi:hypothetical protein
MVHVRVGQVARPHTIRGPDRVGRLTTHVPRKETQQSYELTAMRQNNVRNITVVLVCLCGAATQAQTRRESLVRKFEDFKGRNNLRFQDVIHGADGSEHEVFVFCSQTQSWPGKNSQHIVTTNRNFQVQCITSISAESLYTSSSICSVNGGECLAICRSIRPGFQTETLLFDYTKSGLRLLDRIVDPKEVVIPQKIKLGRTAEAE